MADKKKKKQRSKDSSRFFLSNLTPMGRIIFMGLLISAALGSYTTTIKIYFIFCVTSSFLLVSIILSSLIKPKLSLNRNISAKTTAGQSLFSYVEIKNISLLPGFLLHLGESNLPSEIREDYEGKLIPLLPRGKVAKTKISLTFTKRGAYILQGVKVDTVFPFGLWASRIVQQDPVSILVYPRFNPLSECEIPTGKRYQPGGLALTSSVGDSTEYIGNREYHQGDSRRFIHWRSWARLYKPVVKEFQEEYFCRIALILDTHVPAGSIEISSECFESAVSMAASIADFVARFEYVIDIFVAGPDVYYLQAGRSLAYLENILDLLACVDVCRENPLDRIAPRIAEILSRTSTVILVLLDWDEVRMEFVKKLRDMGTEVKVIIVREGATKVEPGLSESFAGPIRVITPKEERRGIEAL